MKYSYEEMLSMAEVKNWDLERQAFFYIIANNDELNSRFLKIWDFESSALKLYEENKENEIGDFSGEESFYEMSSTARKLYKTALALYNGRNCDLYASFEHLNQEGYLIVSKAIEIRFNLLSSFQYQFEKKKSEELDKYKSQIVELINENREDLKKLNISKVCRILEINRTTFYNYGLEVFFKNLIEENKKA